MDFGIDAADDGVLVLIVELLDRLGVELEPVNRDGPEIAEGLFEGSDVDFGLVVGGGLVLVVAMADGEVVGEIEESSAEGTN